MLFFLQIDKEGRAFIGRLELLSGILEIRVELVRAALELQFLHTQFHRRSRILMRESPSLKM